MALPETIEELDEVASLTAVVMRNIVEWACPLARFVDCAAWDGQLWDPAISRPTARTWSLCSTDGLPTRRYDYARISALASQIRSISVVIPCLTDC